MISLAEAQEVHEGIGAALETGDTSGLQRARELVAVLVSDLMAAPHLVEARGLSEEHTGRAVRLPDGMTLALTRSRLGTRVDGTPVVHFYGSWGSLTAHRILAPSDTVEFVGGEPS